jgi:hypothetical protein
MANPSVLVLAVAIVLALTGATRREVPIEQAALQRFHQAVNDYVALHRRLERGLPPLQISSEWKDIRLAVEARAAVIRDARRDAQLGDIFDTEVSEVFRARIQASLQNNGYNINDVAADLNEEVQPDAERPVVNGRFAWALGAAMPPCILSVLPRLPEELQYWLVGYDLVLVDLDADLVVDLLPHALPGE